ncbi:MAG TPA: tRNA (N(6)-L-threonylcarbamoyladenosine(37)-C(2))-methylthiotransferase MtaB [Xanthobacteraceae bacterium]|nr:tRNA (N(6)-L-threonylcarbamoyladenosine(37)-C(2))-methylthiotransferase MtaB [Xanthobacteraceae bacterium]
MSVDVVTFGCRLNVSESEAVRRHAEAAGLDNTVVINSCAVTAEAVRKAQQTIRRLKREQPQARILVTGCAAQTEPETFAEMREVDQVLGNHAKLHAETWTGAKRALDFGVSAEEKVKIDDLGSVRETALHLVDGLDGHVRAFVQVQNGCDHRCTFCIIPYGRGPSRSVAMGEVVAQARKLVENGYREIVLTGVDLTAWGLDLPGQPRLGALVRAILRHVPELPRLRISSLDPVEIDGDLLRAIAEENRLMPHLHLSLQHGDDLILKRMKRRHLRRDAIDLCNKVRRLRPDMVFGADLIAGFPTESEMHFRNSLALADDCGLTFLHVFPFSPRKGTPAARMPQLARSVIKERAAQLREKSGAMLRRHFANEIGRRRRVIAEGDGREGHSEYFTRVALTRPSPRGEMLEVKISGHDGRRLLAA